MAGIYVHIPFCRQSCSYCDFYFSVNKRHEQAFFNALRTEWSLRRREAERERVETLYFGGGTPSYAEPFFLERVINEITRHVYLAPEAEITLEANPDDMSREKLRQWKDMGINRLSVGVQNFDNRFLQLLNRSHDARRTEQALENAIATGFENITLDLIYGIPGMTLAEWENQIDRFLRLDFPHLSAYALTVEPGTLLDYQVKKGRVHMPSDEMFEKQFFLLRDKLTAAGFRHYEISNFARPGYESKHNTSYWEGKPYMGLGPSAHSYDGNTMRRWNVANLHRYIRGVSGNGDWYETEILGPAELYNEWIMTRLRTDEGVKERDIREKFPGFYPLFRRTAERLCRSGQLLCREGQYRVAPEALFRTDGIIEEFFVVEF